MAIGDGVSAIAQLTVTFGGFSPTAMDGVKATRELVERVEAEQAKRKEAARRERELMFAKTSTEKSFTDASGSIWRYVVVEGKLARIVELESKVPEISVPAEIEGIPVYAIGPDALARNEWVEQVTCPDSIASIGACAFRLCPNLRSVVLPAGVSEYNATWFQNSPRLDSLVLPGLLDKIPRSLFDNLQLKELYVGPSVHAVEPGAFQKTVLERIVVSQGNPYISTDGIGLYSKDGATLLALARPMRVFEVKPGCIALSQKACYGIEALEQVNLPESVVVLDQFAFAHAGIRSFKASAGLKVIKEKAFYHCKQLRDVRLNDGLESIGDSAFEESGLSSLCIPATIREIGTSVTARTNVVHKGAGRSIEIDAACPSLFIDNEGGLYRRGGDGVHLVQLMDREAESFAAHEDTRFVDDQAFAYHERIQCVCLPDGVERIGRQAFRCCRSLRNVQLPDSVAYIGDEAFLDTALTSFRVPAALAALGERALVTGGAHHGDEVPSLREVAVAAGNDRFYVHQGMLCRCGWDDAGESADSVVTFTSSAPTVVFPESIVKVESHAFNNACGIEYLELNERLETISTAGLTTWCWIPHIRVKVAKPIEGRTVFDFEFPDTPKSLHGISLGIGGASWVNVPGIMEQYDICLINAHDYNQPRGEGGIGIHEQVVKVLKRLRDPILLSARSREMYERLLRNHIVDICVDVARHDDRATIDGLADLGFLSEGNLEEVIAGVRVLQDAAMVGYLLEMKRRRFGRAAFDFDL